MTNCNANNCKFCVDNTCMAKNITLRVDSETDEMLCKTFKYKAKEQLDGNRQKDIS